MNQVEKLELELAQLRSELERYKSGNLSDEELQQLCHNLPEDCPERFARGCVEYNRRLFGSGSKLES
mgnify:CR=1 FL=1